MKAVELFKRAAGLTEAIVPMQRVEQIDARLAGIRDEQRALGGYLPPGEIGEALAVWLRERRERFERLQHGEASGARDLVSAIGAGRSLVSTLRTAAPELAVLDLILTLFGEELEDRAHEFAARLQYVPGPGSAERRRKGAALDAERASLMTEREALVDRLAAAGVTVEHLPATRQRRDADALAASRADSEQQRQAALAARVNERERRIA